VIQDCGNRHVINAPFAQIGGAGPSQVMRAKIESRIFLNALAHLLEPPDVSASGCGKDKLTIPVQRSYPLDDGHNQML